jgi:hypothetical protein
MKSSGTCAGYYKAEHDEREWRELETEGSHHA